MTNNTLKLALGWDNETISFWNYKIEKNYKATYIKEYDNVIWVIVDWEIFINWFWKKANFESELIRNEEMFIDLIEKRIKQTESKKSDYYWEIDKLKKEKQALEKKLEDKVVQNTMNDLFPND